MLLLALTKPARFKSLPALNVTLLPLLPIVPAIAFPLKLISPVAVLVVRLICPLFPAARILLKSETVIFVAVMLRLFWVEIIEGAARVVVVLVPVGNLPFTSTSLPLVMEILALIPVVPISPVMLTLPPASMVIPFTDWIELLPNLPKGF